MYQVKDTCVIIKYVIVLLTTKVKSHVGIIIMST